MTPCLWRGRGRWRKCSPTVAQVDSPAGSGSGPRPFRQEQIANHGPPGGCHVHHGEYPEGVTELDPLALAIRGEVQLLWKDAKALTRRPQELVTPAVGDFNEVIALTRRPHPTSVLCRRWLPAQKRWEPAPPPRLSVAPGLLPSNSCESPRAAFRLKPYGTGFPGDRVAQTFCLIFVVRVVSPGYRRHVLSSCSKTRSRRRNTDGEVDPLRSGRPGRAAGRCRGPPPR